MVERLTQGFTLSREEAGVYLDALKRGRATGGKREVLDSLLARGMLIRGGDEKGYLPVHPRLALSNLFRSYQERMVLEMREKRKLVDRLTLELIPVYETGRKPE